VLDIEVTGSEPPELTPRELAVLELCARGESRDEIGRILIIAPRTVREDIVRAREKLNASNVTTAVVACIVLGLFEVRSGRVVAVRCARQLELVA
jgi:DNA-binding CsgD family transcriptional regulator